ncbi:hypothetical protein [Desulfovibrio subterraneus]|uniref:DUF4145 domain-containing protein n=1 Tax=Desulfovibrio subterraneus TaxID=2718620 RepID=A0A7J0BLH7_9BACT|nr:hypothetical protein [Desulfovibrio subterraneus]GFM34015.1 hypothetical protein DSM101010T_23800 [Desulfovibrio subterraneus]
MRDYLKGKAEADYWVYGITEREFTYTIELIQGIVDLRTEKHTEYENEVRRDTPDLADDILDDISYYKYVEEQHLWQFALVRLQGLFESVMTSEFAPPRDGVRLNGISLKLAAIARERYTLTDDEKSELIAWANIRNGIAHAPPEEHRPILYKEDVVEYKNLVLSLYQRWKSEKKARNQT